MPIHTIAIVRDSAAATNPPPPPPWISRAQLFPACGLQKLSRPHNPIIPIPTASRSFNVQITHGSVRLHPAPPPVCASPRLPALPCISVLRKQTHTDTQTHRASSNCKGVLYRSFENSNLLRFCTSLFPSRFFLLSQANRNAALQTKPWARITQTGEQHSRKFGFTYYILLPTVYHGLTGAPSHLLSSQRFLC